MDKILRSKLNLLSLYERKYSQWLNKQCPNIAKKTRGSYGIQVLKFNLDESTETLRFLCYLLSIEKDNKRKRDKSL